MCLWYTGTMKPIIELFDQLIKAHNMNLIDVSYRGQQLSTWAELEIVFTDKVTALARTKLLNHIEKTYSVTTRWVSVDKLHVQERP